MDEATFLYMIDGLVGDVVYLREKEKKKRSLWQRICAAWFDEDSFYYDKEAHE